MSKRSQIIAAAVLVVLIVLVIGSAILVRRGALEFDGIVPRFNADSLTNPTPRLDRDVVFPEDFPAEAREQFLTNVEELREQIRLIPNNPQAWLDLAIYYRMVNDHEGAIEIWEFLRAAIPTDGISRHNLGEYYFHTEKDFEKAEEYYRESITVQPQLSSNYTDLYEMYRYAYKQDTGAATEVLKEGIASVEKAESVDLLVLLAFYYRDNGDIENARKYLTEARDLAREVGNTNRVRTLNQELSRLR